MLIQLQRPRKTTAAHRFYVWTIGCQMNTAESTAIGLALHQRGLEPVATADEADLVVLNGCTVRESAEQRVQGQLHLLAHRKRTDPGLLVALTGCTVSPDLAEMEQRLPMVDFFFRPGALDHFLSQLEAHEVVGLPTVSEPVLGVEQPVSSYVTVMQGCNKYCTYCIVPFRRGREKSRLIPEVVQDVRAMARRGVREVTLLGQIVDSYGRDLPERSHLADLLAAVSEVEDLWRVRFMTSHPEYMDQRLIDAVAALPKACEHINLPVQSGDDVVLERMRRGYTAGQFRELAARIRRTVPGVTLATDIIVGFPGETEAQFQQTLALLADVECDVVHTACYSPREGTVSATWDDDVPPDVKEERRRRVEAQQEAIAARHNAALVGDVVEILVESTQSARKDVPQWRGRTRTNRLVFLPRAESEDLRGRLVEARIVTSSPWALQGEITRLVASG
jgi:tRNA-2-methylthio-N6-dimethylallyladenosine synthase